MLFFSWPFAAFFALFFPLYIAFNRAGVVPRNLFLLAAAYFFYGWWDVRFLGLMAFTTSLDYLAALGAGGIKLQRGDLAKSAGFMGLATIIALALSETQYWHLIGGAGLGALALYTAAFLVIEPIADAQKRRKAWMLLSVIGSLIVLAFFKYFNFLGDSANELVGMFGGQLGFVEQNIILPIAISFITFQSMGRTIDAYRGAVVPSRDFISFATFLSYFPQLLAGPIERASSFLPQFLERRQVTLNGVKAGAALFGLGLFKKLVVSDNLAPLANRVFAEPGSYTSGELLVGALAFTFQIYADFSGYTDMARGLAKMMGFELRLNFLNPYWARTPSEFWQRWHISLSQWLRDYLYISMGGNRLGSFLTYRNLMLTMLLGGLWHGAAWTFVIWGFLHGGIQVIYRLFRIDDLLAAKRHLVGWNIGAWLAWTPFVILTWIFFRAETADAAFAMIGGIMQFSGISEGSWATLGWFAALLIPIEIHQRFFEAKRPFASWPFLVRFTCLLIMLLVILTQMASSSPEFIYFAF